MTGEMYREDVTRDAYPLHFAIADALGGTVEPFDVYQGPYVLVGSDIRSGDEPYAVVVRGLGVVRLWVCTDDGALGSIYNEANEVSSPEFFLDGPLAEEQAVEAAKTVVGMDEKGTK